MSYIVDQLVALDIAINVLFGGEEDETISSRVRRASDAHPSWSLKQPGVLFAKLLNAALNLIQHNHGLAAEQGDLKRADAVVSTEDQALGVK